MTSAIKSIEAQSLRRDQYELIVVDNSEPGANREAFFEDVSIDCNATYLLEDAPGLSRARNIGVGQAKGGYVAFLDDDAEAHPDWLRATIAAFERSPKLGVVGGPVEPIWDQKRPAWLHPDQEGFLTIVDRGPDARPVARDEWLAGTNIAFRRAVLLEAGGFDVSVGRIGRLLLSNEELLVTEKIRALGFEVLYEPAMRMRHRVHDDRVSQRWMRRRAAWQAVSDIMSKPSDDLSGDDAMHADIEQVRSFFTALPIRRRKFSAIMAEQTRADDFNRQIGALGALTRLILLHGVGPE